MADTDTTRLSPFYSTDEAQAALVAGVGAPVISAARAWLKEHEPSALAQNGEWQVLDTAFQAAIHGFEASPDDVVDALAHCLALVISAQDLDRRQEFFADVGRRVLGHLRSIDAQAAQDKASAGGQA